MKINLLKFIRHNIKFIKIITFIFILLIRKSLQGFNNCPELFN